VYCDHACNHKVHVVEVVETINVAQIIFSGVSFLQSEDLSEWILC